MPAKFSFEALIEPLDKGGVDQSLEINDQISVVLFVGEEQNLSWAGGAEVKDIWAFRVQIKDLALGLGV